MRQNENETSATVETTLGLLGQLVGSWTTEATHPAMPGVVVHGSVLAEWLEGKRFVMQRARTDHPDFPDSMCIIGFTDLDRVDDTAIVDDTNRRPTLHYFDSRGVFRVLDVEVDDQTLRFHRDSPGFSQRCTSTFADDGNTIVGRWELCRDDGHWNDDLQITYRRVS